MKKVLGNKNWNIFMASNEKLTLIKTKCENETENIFLCCF